MNKKFCNRWLFLIIGFFSMLFIGILYAWPILKVPLKAEFMWSESALSLNFTLVMCFFCLGNLAGGIYSSKVRPSVLLYISAALILGGFALFSFYRGESALALYLSYGVCLSLGIGIAYNAVISMVSSWFRDKKGLCSGILMMGFGASSMLLGSIADRLIASPAFGWRLTFLAVGIAVGLMVLISALILRSNSGAKAASADTAPDQRSFTTKEMLRTSSFWRLFIFAVTNVGVGVAIVGASKDISLSFNATETLATSLVGILSICNGAGRIISGLLFDRIGYRKTVLFGSTINLIGPALLLLAVTQGLVLPGAAAICIVGIAYGFAPPFIASTVQEFYGLGSFSANFSVASLFLIPASFSSTVTGTLVTNSGTYVSSLLFLLALACVSFILSLTVKSEAR